jgi:hypothetical protein
VVGGEDIKKAMYLLHNALSLAKATIHPSYNTSATLFGLTCGKAHFNEKVVLPFPAARGGAGPIRQ